MINVYLKVLLQLLPPQNQPDNRIGLSRRGDQVEKSFRQGRLDCYIVCEILNLFIPLS